MTTMSSPKATHPNRQTWNCIAPAPPCHWLQPAETNQVTPKKVDPSLRNKGLTIRRKRIILYQNWRLPAPFGAYFQAPSSRRKSTICPRWYEL